VTGKGECKCHAGDRGCQCGKDCKCVHCASVSPSGSDQKPAPNADSPKTVK
jgi:hypothetical protein